MSVLADIVEIDRRFARSARIDSDLKGSPPLVGYVLQASTAKALTAMASAQIESAQGAYTWTGPYGGGKSSAALLVGNLVGGCAETRAIARDIAGPEVSALFAEAFPERNGAWTVVAVTGSRASLRDVIAEACRDALGWPKAVAARAAESNDALIEALLNGAQHRRSGILLLLDELGKLLEHAASDSADVHLLQDLAERSTRSEGRLVVVGILHQAFEQYAAKAQKDSRDEWVKVQGRYQDISFLTGADESVALLARAVRCDARPESAAAAALAVAEAVAKRRPTDVAHLAETLGATWPLNPVTALLLGPVSRQRFAQNERSVFGFLGSAEPFGFQAHLTATETLGHRVTYDPDQLWDYLAANFGMALASGTDGARFSLAFEAIDRAAAKGSALHVSLTKAAAVIEFFRNGSGVALAEDFLFVAAPYAAPGDVRSAIADLLEWAVLIAQPRLGGYALFAGSDFDLEEALAKLTEAGALSAEQLATVPQRVGLGFAAAKRHYFKTGALRTFEVVLQLITSSDKARELAASLAERRYKGSGMLVLLLSDGDVELGKIRNHCKGIAKALAETKTVAAVGCAANSYWLRPNAGELFAIERLTRENPRLEGDRIARREIAARHSACVDLVYRDLDAALNGARWWLAPQPDQPLSEPLPIVASVLADIAFSKSPILKSELLQRDRPSSNAMAAARELCHAMVTRGTERDLGFEGYPAGMGLYLTVLEPFGLHAKDEKGVFGFRPPTDKGPGLSLAPVWEAMEREPDVCLEDVYKEWGRPPIGLKAGLMPVLALASILARQDSLAVYVEDVFQTALDDVFVDKLLQKPGDIRLRRVDRSNRDLTFLHGLARHLGVDDVTKSLPVAQALFQRYENLPTYSQRTDTLSKPATTVRGVILKAKDPEALLFDALPAALGKTLSSDKIFAALVEAEAAYGAMLETVRVALADALGVDAATFGGIAARVDVIKGLTNDWTFEGFVSRSAAFETGEGDMEGLAGLLLHKSPKTWSDRDRDQALIEIARIGRRFRELEAVAQVRGRPSRTEAMAVVVGIDPNAEPILARFDLTASEQKAATALATQLLTMLAGSAGGGRVHLGALVRAVETMAAETRETETA